MMKFSELFGLDSSDNKSIKKSTVKSYKKITPWVDKYRPKKLDDVIHQDEIIKMLKETVKTGNLPHLLLHGPPGTGKTSTILAIANELFGPKRVHERVIELNASDERGINIVRNKIVGFSKTAIGTADKNYPSPDYKIIILDEADAMTKEAQSALRKTMEDNSNITRFCFICNYLNQIIDPINSRCVKFRFKPLSEKCISKRLTHIAKCEKMNINEIAIDTITKLSDGDMRKSIMLLQNIKYIKLDNSSIAKEDVLNMACCVTKETLDKVQMTCITDKEINSEEILELTKKIRSLGYPIQNTIKQIDEMIIYNDELDDKMKSKICIEITKIQRNLADGADEFLQLLNLFTSIKSISCNIK